MARHAILVRIGLAVDAEFDLLNFVAARIIAQRLVRDAFPRKRRPTLDAEIASLHLVAARAIATINLRLHRI
jgi:hypothetical protein